MATKLALVTGVGRAEGIGFEVCRQLAQHGFTVLLTARDQAKASRLAGQLSSEGLDVVALALDVTASQGPASPFSVAAELAERYGYLDVLVNNAATLVPFGEQALTADLAAAHLVLETALFGSWRTAQAFAALLAARGEGRVVNVSSGAGSHGDSVFGLTTRNGMGTSYAVAKAALNALTVKLSLEFKERGVLVNAVDPGFTATFEGAEAMGARPVSEGAAGIVWAALLPKDGPTGGFFRDGNPLPW